MIRIIKTLSIITLAILTGSCESDYNLSLHDVTRYIVMNCIIEPDVPVVIQMSKSFSSDDVSYTYTERARFVLFEEHNPVYQTTGFVTVPQGGEYIIPFSPSAGKAYRLEIEIPDYGTLWATTSIPYASENGISVLYVKHTSGNYAYNSYMHYRIDSFPEQSARACWVRCHKQYLTKVSGINVRPYVHLENVGMYSTDSPFIDQVNGAYDAEDAALRESSMYYESFIRIPEKNILTALPLLLSMQCAVKSQFWLSPSDSLWHSPTYYFHGMQFEVITPSDEYDYYTRSLYKQKKNLSSANNPFVEPVSVYCNINNGLGIFAGLNRQYLMVKYSENK